MTKEELEEFKLFKKMQRNMNQDMFSYLQNPTGIPHSLLQSYGEDTFRHFYGIQRPKFTQSPMIGKCLQNNINLQSIYSRYY